jgi:hypothetical protein
MSTQISAPIRVLALIGLLASLAMGAWTFTAGRSTTSSSGVGGSMHHDIAAAKSGATKLDAHNKSTAGATTRLAAAATAVAPKPVVRKTRPAAVKPLDGGEPDGSARLIHLVTAAP